MTNKACQGRIETMDNSTVGRMTLKLSGALDVDSKWIPVHVKSVWIHCTLQNKSGVRVGCFWKPGSLVMRMDFRETQ